MEVTVRVGVFIDLALRFVRRILRWERNGSTVR